jgi:hypothetical protein
MSNNGRLPASTGCVSVAVYILNAMPTKASPAQTAADKRGACRRRGEGSFAGKAPNRNATTTGALALGVAVTAREAVQEVPGAAAAIIRPDSFTPYGIADTVADGVICGSGRR